MNDSKIIVQASEQVQLDVKYKKIAADILKILADNSTTVSEVTTILKMVEKMIVNARLDSLQFSQGA